MTEQRKLRWLCPELVFSMESEQRGREMVARARECVCVCVCVCVFVPQGRQSCQQGESEHRWALN